MKYSLSFKRALKNCGICLIIVAVAIIWGVGSLSAATIEIKTPADITGPQSKVTVYLGTVLFPGSPTDDPVGASTGGMVSVSGISTAASNSNTIQLNLDTSPYDYTFIGGGYASAAAHTQNATGNSVVLVQGTVGVGNGGSVIGGITASTTAGASTGDAIGNSVTIRGGTVSNQVIGGFSTHGDALLNQVSITNATVNHAVFGGIASQAANATEGDAYRNTVEIFSGTFQRSVTGGSAEIGAANENIVVIHGGTFNEATFGGRSFSTTLSMSGNVVIIEGGTFAESITGGMLTNATATGNVNNSVVILRGAPVLTGVVIEGGQSLNTTTPGNLIRGNTLIFENYTGPGTTTSPIINIIRNFQIFEFFVDRSVAKDDVIIYADNLVLGTGADAAYVSSFSVLGGNRVALNVGDSLTLIRANTLTGAVDTTRNKLTGYQGSLLQYDFLLSNDTTDLKVTVTGIKLDTRAKVLSEAFFGSLGLLINSFDFVTGQAMDSVLETVRGARVFGGEPRINVFGTAHGGKVRYDTGSYVDVSGFSGIIGVSGHVHRDAFEFTIGVFGEAGSGDYDTLNTFPNMPELKGKGDINYGGAGIFGRFDFSKGERGHFHLEFAARFGSVKNTYNSIESQDVIREFLRYVVKSNYYGLHLGGGYTFNFDDKYLLDLFVKYYWLSQQGETVTLSGGDDVTFDDANSSRLKGGLRLILNTPVKVKPYFGVAYEHEMDGKVSGRAYNMNFPTTDPSGGSFVGEIGLLVVPTEKVSINFGVQGYAGARKGVTGSIGLKFMF